MQIFHIRTPLAHVRGVVRLDFELFGSAVKRNFSLAEFLTSPHLRMHRVIFYTSNTLRKLMIRA